MWLSVVMQSAALQKKKIKKNSKREKSATACMFSLLTGIGARLQSKAVPDPGHPYTSKTLCPVSDLLGEPDCMDSGLQPLRGRRWMTDFSLLPHQRPCKWKEPSPSPRLTELSEGIFANSAHTKQWGFSSVWWDILLITALASQFHSAAFILASWYQPPASPSLMSLTLFLWK